MKEGRTKLLCGEIVQKYLASVKAQLLRCILYQPDFKLAGQTLPFEEEFT